MAQAQPSFIRPEELWRTVGLRAGQTIIHLGCGPGYYLIPAAKIIGRQGKAIGVDVRPDMLAETESRAQREGVDDIISTVRVDLEHNRLPAPEHSADWVLVANILHQAEPAAILKQAQALVKPAGSIVVVEWDIAASPMGPPANLRRSPQETENLAHDLGLHTKQAFRPSSYHYGFVLTPQIVTAPA